MSEQGGGVGAAIATQAHTAQSSAQMRQVLAAYVRNAHTLTGPSRLEEQIGVGKFKLASDVVLHRVSGPSDLSTNGSYRREPGFSNGHHQSLDIKQQIWLQRERFLRQVQEQHMLTESERLREKQLPMRPVSGPERSNHLSGEKIRLLRETQREAEKLRSEVEHRVKEEMKDSKQTKRAFKSPPVSSAVPIMSSSDKSWSDLEETIIEGERISCFNVGGEPRLCLPQILNSVLERLSLKDINQACEELQIYCATCSPEQLQVLKESKVLPDTAYQCGLITKSDAERLCSFLLERNPPKASIRLGDPKTSPFSFRVEHECFGWCEGLVLPEAYTGPSARCIECMECEGLFSPQKFVSHAHERPENRTCHWGFSSDHWRIYLRLAGSYTEDEAERYAKVLENFKRRYLPGTGIKRHQEEDHYEDLYSHSKRSKLEDLPPAPDVPYSIVNFPGLPAFRPWSPGKEPDYPAFPFSLQQQAYSRAQFKEKVSAALKYEGYGAASTAVSKDNNSQSVLPKKKYLEKENEKFPTLADEISTIKEVLDGAPVYAKEAVLKILERLTQRVDRAERDRDLAITRFRELNLKYGQLENELAKKREELRELLRQDLKPASETELTKSKVSSNEKEDKETLSDNISERSLDSCSSKAENYSRSGLPKIMLKSPAQVIEEISRPRSTSAAGRLDDRRPVHQGPQESENLKERMIKMEALITALREELSTTSQANKIISRDKSPIITALSYSYQKLGSNGANSGSTTPSPPSQCEELPALAE